MIKVVLFDLDDTLTSEYEYVLSGFKHIAHLLSEKFSLNIEKIYKDMVTLFEIDSKYVYNRLLDLHNIRYEQHDIDYLIQEYRQHKPQIEYYDDVIPTLNILRTKGQKLGIVTDGYIATQTNKLVALDAYNMFDKIILTDAYGREYWKPHPRAFEEMKDYFGVEYEEMAYVGDNPEKDFYIRKNVPIKTVRIVREKSIYRDAEYLQDIREQKRVANLLDCEF